MVATTSEEYEDGGFYGYIPTTTNPGPALLVVTIAICILLNALLPCIVAWGRHREKRREKEVQEDPWAVKPNEDGADKGLGFMQNAPPSMRSISDVSQSLRIVGPGGVSGPRSSGGGGHQLQHPHHRYGLASRSTRAPSVMSYGASMFGGQSVISVGTVGTGLNQSVVHGMSGRRAKTQRRFRRAMEKRVSQVESGGKAESFFRFDQQPVGGMINGGPTPYHYPTDRTRVGRNNNIDDDNRSFLSKMDTDEVSVQSLTMDADNEDFISKLFLVDEDEVEITCCGVDAWWKPNWVIKYFERVVALAEYDFEMKKILKLTLPFASQALFTGVLDVMTVAIVGKHVGTAELSAYVMVDMVINLTNELAGGFVTALTTLCSQAVGAKQNNMAGQYVQMAVLLYIGFSIPFIFLWWSHTHTALSWFGFDEATAQIGQDFAKIYLFSHLVEGTNEALHALLEVIGLENYSTVMGISEDILDFVITLNAAIFFSPKLWHLGVIHTSVGLLFTILNLVIIWWRGWYDPYLHGMIGTFSLTNVKAVWLMCKTSLALTVGYLLTDGEWEILTLLASFLGPAEVAAWSILGTLWGAIEDLTEAIGDAAEVRCAFLLGCGKPKHAQVSAYKSMLIATIVAFFVTSVVFILGEDLATWMTEDPVLQQMIIELMPLFGLGNITMTVGTVSWTLLGSQGRYRLATTIAFCGSWLLTIPLSCFTSVALNLSLAGQTAAVVIGYMASGTTNAYFLFRSDWEKLSLAIIESHEHVEEVPKATTAGTDAQPQTSSADDVSVKSHEASDVDAIDRRDEELKTP